VTSARTAEAFEGVAEGAFAGRVGTDVVFEFELQGEQARFVAINRAGWGTYSVLGWIGAGPLYLTFERAG